MTDDDGRQTALRKWAVEQVFELRVGRNSYETFAWIEQVYNFVKDGTLPYTPGQFDAALKEGNVK